MYCTASSPSTQESSSTAKGFICIVIPGKPWAVPDFGLVSSELYNSIVIFDSIILPTLQGVQASGPYNGKAATWQAYIEHRAARLCQLAQTLSFENNCLSADSVQNNLQCQI